MDEQQKEFRTGIMAFVAIAATVIMVFQFGDIGQKFKAGTRITIVMADATGVTPQTAVTMSGIRIGQIENLKLVADGRGVVATAVIDPEYQLKSDSRAQISQSLLGDGNVEIIPGQSGEILTDGGHIVGQQASDPMKVIAKLESKVSKTLESFEMTGHQWARLGNNLNILLESSGEDGINTIQRSAAALEQFSRTMKTAENTLAAAGKLIGDPRHQQQMTATLTALPQLLNDTRVTMNSVNRVVTEMRSTVQNINTATTPLAQQSQTMVTRLNNSLANIDRITTELATLSNLMNQNDGTIRKLVTDPTLYRNLNNASSSLAVLMKNLGPVIADLQVFSDKVARHPELLGVRGVVKGSNGTKDDAIAPASFQRTNDYP